MTEAFLINSESISLTAGERMFLPLHFLAFQMGLHIARISFVDDRVGEFLYEVNVVVGLPDTVETIKVVCEERGSVDKQISIVAPNAQLAAAFATFQKLAADLDTHQNPVTLKIGQPRPKKGERTRQKISEVLQQVGFTVVITC